MKKSREPSSVRDIRLGRDVCFDAWLYSMLMDNNLAYRMNPDTSSRARNNWRS